MGKKERPWAPPAGALGEAGYAGPSHRRWAAMGQAGLSS